MSQIEGRDRMHFDACIAEKGLAVESFEISEERDKPGATKRLGTGWVSVLYKPAEISRQYRNGVVPPPHVEFARELKMNWFQMQ